MDWHNTKEPDGRYIGRSGSLHVYSGGFTENPPSHPPMEEYSRIPGEFDFMYGPVAGGLMESTGIKFTTPGEQIRRTIVYPDFKKRTIQVRGLGVDDALLRIERINGFHSASHAIGFLSAVEDALDISVDDDIRDKRIAMIELERVRSNLEVVKRICEPTGLGVAANQIGYIREEVSRTIASAAGHRFFFGVNGLNKADIDLTEVWKRISPLRGHFKRIFEGLQESKIFLNRLQTTGIVRRRDLVGPVARSSGLRYDARLDSGTLDYSGTGYEPIVRDERDSFARFMVRAGEILTSSDIIRSIGNPSGNGNGNRIDTTGSGEGTSRVESPQGDLFYHVKLNQGKVEKIDMVSPTGLNISAFEDSMPSNILSDFHVNWETFGLWIAEMGVELI